MDYDYGVDAEDTQLTNEVRDVCPVSVKQKRVDNIVGLLDSHRILL